MEIDYQLFEELCFMPIDDFKQYGHVVKDYPDMLIYKDNQSSVLAIAHLDSIQKCAHFKKYNDPIYKEWVSCPVLDDRSGVYIILDLLPKLGVNVDILLTTNEERSMSSALFFESVKKYNWIVEFDRMGDDVVAYQYETKRFKKLLKKSGFSIGDGSYSDICDLSHLECLGFNVGIGYHNYHSLDAWLSVPTMIKQVIRFSRFYSANKDTHFPYNSSMFTRQDKLDFRDERDKWSDDTIAWYTGSNKYWSNKPIDILSENSGADDNILDTYQCELCEVTFSYNDLTYDKDYGFICSDCAYWLDHSYNSHLNY